MSRQDYKAGALVRSEFNNDPILQFMDWLDAAMQAELHEPTAMNLATCSRDGNLSSRMVLLKEVDERGFVFFTNYRSRKGADMESNCHAALCFWWGKLERQVRIEGAVEQVSVEESDEYFRTRPRGSQIGAIASRQSTVLDSYQDLRRQVKDTQARYANSSEIPRPDYWGGYRVIPKEIEFWQGRSDRLHDRLRYRKQGGHWVIERLSP